MGDLQQLLISVLNVHNSWHKYGFANLKKRFSVIFRLTFVWFLFLMAYQPSWVI